MLLLVNFSLCGDMLKGRMDVAGWLVDLLMVEIAGGMVDTADADVLCR